LRIFGLSPIDDARSHPAQIGQIFFGALERVFFDDGLRRRCLNVASFEPPQRRAKHFVGRAKLFQQTSREPGGNTGVKVNAIQEREKSSSIERPPQKGAYVAGNCIVESLCENLG